MKRIIPPDIYRGLPCSVVALGTAMGVKDKTQLIMPDDLKADGYLSLNGMSKYIRGKVEVQKKLNYKRGDRPALRDFVHGHEGKKAIVCCLGHFVYVDGRDYHSYFYNGGDEVVCAWILK